MSARVFLLAAVVALAGVAQAATIHIATAENGGDDSHDGSSGSPVATLARAVALANEDDTVLFGDGAFEEPAVQVTVDKNITITSQNGPTKTTFRSLHTGVVGNVTDHSGWLFLTNCPKALVSGIYFCGKKTDGTQPTIRTAVYMTETAGTVSNCVFRYLKGGVWYGGASSSSMQTGGMGPAAFMYGGTIVDCLFEENCANRWYPRGGAVSMGNLGCTGTPLVDRCTFNRNWCAEIGGNNSSMGGALWMAHSAIGGATVRNSLFYGNHSDKGYTGAIGYTWYAANDGQIHIINCTAVSNTCSTANQTSERTWCTSAKCLFDSLTWGNYSADVVEDTENPGFVNAAGGDFHLAAGSSAIDASVNTTYAKGDFDLDRNARVMGTKADKGCYEFDPNQFSLGIAFEKLDTFAPARVHLWAVTTGGTADDDASYWTFDGEEPTASHYDAKGTNVTVTLDAGTYTVRFATTAKGTAYSVTQANWFSFLGKNVYVRKGNAGAQSPYESWEHAAAEVQDAMAIVVSGQTVIIDDGTYYASTSYVIPADTTVRSVNGPARTKIDFSAPQHMMYLGGAGSVVSGLYLCNSLNSGDYGTAGISMTGNSLVTNCVFDTCSSLGSAAAALNVEAGTVVDCVFTNIYSKTGARGIAIDVGVDKGGGLVDRCRVYDSHYVGEKGAYANEVKYGAVMVCRGTVRNTLVTGTRSGGCVGIYVGVNGKVENCTVVSNRSLKATDYAYGIYVGNASGSVSNTVSALNVNVDGDAADAGAVEGAESRFGRCAVPGGFGADSVSGDLCFRNAAKGDFHLRPTSPCVNAAAVQSWMTDAKDLDGQPRIQRRPDIGCYERDRTGLAIMVK